MVLKTNDKDLKFTYTAKTEAFEAPFKVKIGRFSFKILSKVSTKLSIRMATYLFFRPRRQPFKTFDIEMIKKSKEEIISFDDRLIHTYKWGEIENGKILFVHGWEGKGTSIKHMINPLMSHGWQIISFDAPAHGKSSGNSTDLPEMISTIKQMDYLFGPFDAIISHSFGSLATLHAFKESSINKKLILISSMSNPFTAIKGFQYIFGLNDKIISGLLDNISKRVGKSLEEFKLDSLEFSESNNILLIHDQQDLIAPFSESLYLLKKFHGAKLEQIESVGHHKILSHPMTISLVENFLN